MGNHTIAERMYRRDPSVMLYAPLRTAIFVDGHGHAKFAVDEPGSVFASFASVPISQVGLELSRKLADLLEALDVVVGGLLDGR